MKAEIFWALLCLLGTSCAQITSKPAETILPESPTTQTTMDTLPNPASAYCEQQGYALDIRTADEGSQFGVCIFPDGSECDEWAYFRNECKPSGTETPAVTPIPESNGWNTHTNDILGYSFNYPAGAQIITNDEPLKSLTVSGPSMGGETWSIAHPADRDEFRPPEGVDLMQWLTDHYLVGEARLPDEQIAGTMAIHFRHERSSQSPADDKYFFAMNGQLYLVTIGHSSEVENWELNNRFLQSIQFGEPAPTSSFITAIPTALPVNPASYADWMTYTNPVYNFTLRLPDVWVVEEVTTGDPTMVGHLLNLYSLENPQEENIRLSFRNVGEDTPLWPTGVGQGEFVPQGTLDIAGKPAQRILLVCPSGEITEIWYRDGEGQPAITRGDFEFGIIFSTFGHCKPGYGIVGEAQLVGETIISSLNVP
jgi:putative hemolysin